MLRSIAAALTLLSSVVSTTPAAAWAATTAAQSPAPAATQNVSGARIAEITDKLADGLVHDPDRAVVPAYRPADQAVPAGRIELTALAPLVYATYVAIPVQIAVDGRVAKTIMAGYRVQQFIHTAVAAHDLTPGAILGAGDLTPARVLSSGRPSVDVAALLGRKIRAATPRGAVIFVEQTMINELVKAGSGAILVVHDGPVSLTADVIARTGGGLGESVTVYNAQTNKLLSGTVTGPDRVELSLPGGDTE
jgi:flagella basal body P-ring formation protein FlgA